ncbi:hypothetical protein ACLOJK_041513 [Asimina triloba]
MPILPTPIVLLQNLISAPKSFKKSTRAKRATTRCSSLESATHPYGAREVGLDLRKRRQPCL